MNNKRRNVKNIRAILYACDGNCLRFLLYFIYKLHITILFTNICFFI